VWLEFCLFHCFGCLYIRSYNRISRDVNYCYNLNVNYKIRCTVEENASKFIEGSNLQLYTRFDESGRPK